MDMVTALSPPQLFGDPRTVEITVVTAGVRCCFCKRNDINVLEWGPLLRLDDVVAHYYCLLFSSGVNQRGNDNEGILGFMLDDIRQEQRRGARLTCKFCRKTGATIGCVVRICGHSFHYPCGYENGCLNQFLGQFNSYCRFHKPKQVIPAGTCRECCICMTETADNEGIWPPCCKKQLFHRSCIMKSAIAAGYFFKCPLCNSTDAGFMQSMQENGVFIPQRDAAWELEPNAFQDLLISHRCDAKDCVCPKGRDYNPTTPSKSWDIVRCGDCGSVGTHRKCNRLQVAQWKCDDCEAFSKKSEDDSGVNCDANSDESDEEVILRQLPSVSSTIRSHRYPAGRVAGTQESQLLTNQISDENMSSTHSRLSAQLQRQSKRSPPMPCPYALRDREKTEKFEGPPLGWKMELRSGRREFTLEEAESAETQVRRESSLKALRTLFNSPGIRRGRRSGRN